MVTDKAEQIKFWQGDFGRQYTDRNLRPNVVEFDEHYLKTWGVNRSDLNHEFLNRIDRNAYILEVGCNVGHQLRHLQLLGFRNLYGIEIQWDAIKRSRNVTKNIEILQGSAFELPFKSGSFDLVFTSGVLIHINPQHIHVALEEIFRCTRQYVWGFEYYSEKIEELEYRGYQGYLWKGNLCQLYLDLFPSMRVVNEKKIKYVADDNVDQMFLLKK